MAIISSYPYDVTIQDNDAWIGTDSINRQTKQYTANSIAKYLNINGKLSVGGQMVYGFSSLPLGGTGTFSLPNGGGSSAYSAINSIKISILEKSGQNVVPFVSYLVGSEILINAQDEAGSFGHYGVTSYVVDPDDSGFYIMGLSYIGGNGNVTSDKLYDIVNFTKSTTAEVEAVNGGLGIDITGTTKQPVVNIDYSGSNNFIEIAPEITSVDPTIYSPELLVSKSNPGEPVSEVKKIKVSNITLDKLGNPSSSISLNNFNINNLAAPINDDQAVNRGYLNSALTGYVQSVTSGNGVTITGSSATPTLAVDYSTGADNLIQSAPTTTSFNLAEPYADYILKSAANPGVTNGAVEKIRSSDIPLNAFGEATGTLSMGNRRIKNLGTPIDSTDTASKAYVDAAVVGGLFYQGSYNASTNTPDLDRDAVVKTVGITSMGSGGGPLGSTVVNTFATTGTGQGLTLNIELNPAGNVISATVANGGTGYATGDTIGLTGLSGHSGSVISIATIATTGSPAASIGIKKGWTYTVVADGDFYGEQVRIGDVLIAESDDPGDLVNWTTVQNNIDLASSTQVGIGNVLAGEAVDVTYNAGSATVSVEDSTASNKGAVIVAGGTNISVAYVNGTATVTNTYTSPINSAGGSIAAGQTSATVTHNFGTKNVVVETTKANGDQVYCDVNKTTNTVVVSINSGASQGSAVNIKVYKII